MKASLSILIGVAMAIRQKHPNVEQDQTPDEFHHDQLGWASFNDTDDSQLWHDYERKVPERFSNLNDDDRFMHSMITQYALEERDDNGQPNGNFYLEKEQAKAAATEVVATHKNLSGKELDDYMLANFWDAWRFIDSANDGKVEAARMAGFMREICHDASLNL